jgi:hypothetical protein
MLRKDERVQAVLAAGQPLLAVLLAPVVSLLPLAIQRYDDPFLPFGKAVVQATRDIAQIYAFDLAAYLALGGAGAVALERTIRFVDENNLTIIHGPFNRQAFSGLTDIMSFGADAVTGLSIPPIGLISLNEQVLHIGSAIARVITVGQDTYGAGDMPEYTNKIREQLLA